MPSIAETILAKKLLPTALDSREIREQWSRQLREQALFSAQMTLKGYLERLQGVLAAVADGRLDASAARLTLWAKLAELGYAAPGTGLKDAASTQRLNLILKTNRQTAGSLAQIARSQDPIMLLRFPAWELVRGGFRKVHRNDWQARWQAAGQAVNWRGAHRTRMAALKSSPIWKALGDGAGGFRDTLGNPYPPFAFGSSYEWSELSLTETQDLGLLPKAKDLGKPVANSNLYKCSKCGKFAHADGSCNHCGETLDTDAMIQRGREALSRALDGKPRDIQGAMHKPGLGSIHFLLGWKGKGNAQEKGKGLVKILQKHRRELDRLPETIAKGKVYPLKSRETGRNDPNRKVIVHGSFLAFLSRHQNGWAVTSHYQAEETARAIRENH